MYLYIILILIVIAVWICLIIIKRKYFAPAVIVKKPKVPVFGYKLHCSDQDSEYGKKAVIHKKLLESEKYGLKGKPDFVFKHRRKNIFVPVELKSGIIGDKPVPKAGDLMQLAAYFFILEDAFGGSVPEGRLVYKDRMFIIKNTPELSAKLLGTVTDMRTMLKTGEGEHNASFANCKYCVMKGTVCEFNEE